MAREKGCKDAKNTQWKQSDQKELGSDGKILAVLKKNQPLDVAKICEYAKIDSSTFYRRYRVLNHHRMIKKVDHKYALWEYEERPTYWKRVEERMAQAGGKPIKLEVEKLTLGDQDPITGWYKRIFDKKVTIEGIFIPKVATELIEAAKINIGKAPLSGEDYVAALITRDFLDEGDRFKWQNRYYIIWQIDIIPEGNEISYYIMHLKVDHKAIIDGEV